MSEYNKWDLPVEFINDIKICNKVYEEYQTQSIKTLYKYEEIFNKYKDQIHYQERLSLYCSTNSKKIIGKFYKFNESTNKLIIPIFYKDYTSVEKVINDYYTSMYTFNRDDILLVLNGFCNNIFTFSDAYKYSTKNISYYTINIDYINNLHSWISSSSYKNFPLKQQLKYNSDNTFEFTFIPFKSQHELEIEKRLNNLELVNSKLQNENIILKEKVRQNQIELHYLKSINKEKIVKYNYQEIKNRNKQLNSEFKRVYKLISKNIGFNLISQ